MVLVEISQERLIELEQCELMLTCLEAVGVDHWEGWNEAMALYSEERGEI